MRPTFAEFLFSYELIRYPPAMELHHLLRQLDHFAPGIRRWENFADAIAGRMAGLSPEFWDLKTLQRIWGCYLAWCADTAEVRAGGQRFLEALRSGG